MITRMRRLAAFYLALPYFVALAALSACAGRPDSGARELGSLQLREALSIEAGAATARLQYGRIVARNAVQEHDPFCVFEIESVRSENQTVAPGDFAIVAISRSIETIAGMPVSPSGWLNRRVSLGNDDSPTHIYFKTAFRLRDPLQSVRALTCMSNQNAPGNALMRHLTLAEIRAALGERFTLNLYQ